MKAIDLTGERFGRLRVAMRQGSHICPSGQVKAKWLCVCDCGATAIATSQHLKRGEVQSCGCFQSECSQQAVKAMHARNITHGHAGRRSREYRTWSGMMQRCTNPKTKEWRYYGGRGISVCERWLKFQNFLDDMGTRPDGHELERINNNGNYAPGNCKWATRLEQMRNTRRCLKNKRYLSPVKGMATMEMAL